MDDFLDNILRNEETEEYETEFSLIEQERMIEAMIFAADKPLSLKEMHSRMPKTCDIEEILARLRERYSKRGFHLVKILDSYAFRTASDMSFLLQRHVVEQRKLSKAALEVLAIIAYHNSSTRAEIEEIRGVSVSSGTLDLLMELGWVTLGKRRKTPGRPVTFKVTKTFLDHFGLESVNDLPGMDELRQTGLLERTLI